MQAIRYSKRRLLWHARVIAVLLASCIYALAYPAENLDGMMIVFANPVGRAVILPSLTLFGLYHLWRVLALAFTTADALAFNDEGMRIVTAGGATQLAWADFQGAKIRRVRLPLLFGYRHLILNRTQGRPIRLRIDLTSAHGANDAMLFELIRLTQAAAFARGKPVGPAFHRELGSDEPMARPSADGAFDPDAALARYLARKQAEAVASPPPTPHGRKPTGFGRKGL